MSWYDFLSDGDFWSGAVSGLAQAGVGLLSSRQQQSSQERAWEREDELREQQLAEARENQAFEYRLAALKALHGGGGGGGASTRMTDAQRISAMQNQAELKQRSIADMMNVLQNAYSLGGRS